MITIINLSEANLFINLSQTITHSDYENVLEPVITDILKQHSQINVCIIFANDFSGFEFHALIDDAMMGIKYWQYWHKIALVSEPKWLHSIATTIEAINPISVESFSTILQAELWFNEEEYF
ncbi:STAS/SEC14 domain-containing protein [Moritella viscosa]|uniref:STAS/SEC14 domain-containing protein n=1 Tax=Moritella viscosa TaxID=80854 RepID=A0ABY1HHY4_9GAMM|nr:STAS/SEC14 domain-containing protein [Moritella viscosa]SGY93808.1 Putative uncharacterized protein [Moritella viscosa]SGY99063.1 Putative uncharacterized protein [Moritella viscosa]SGZ05228.1 Putative uncharacterized protein [Moritella viscosa]SHO26730.1 Putative uncharacterized protein [Moritella viscosa]